MPKKFVPDTPEKKVQTFYFWARKQPLWDPLINAFLDHLKITDPLERTVIAVKLETKLHNSFNSPNLW